MAPIDPCCLKVYPILGNSTCTISPSSFYAWSVIPTLAREVWVSNRTHSWSLVYLVSIAKHRRIRLTNINLFIIIQSKTPAWKSDSLIFDSERIYRLMLNEVLHRVRVIFMKIQLHLWTFHIQYRVVVYSLQFPSYPVILLFGVQLRRLKYYVLVHRLSTNISLGIDDMCIKWMNHRHKQRNFQVVIVHQISQLILWVTDKQIQST